MLHRVLRANGCCAPTEAIINQRLLSFTPGSQRFAAKTAVPAHDDPGVRAASANLGDNGLQGTQRTLAGIALAGAQLGPNRHFAQESIEGQVTIVAVIAMKESPLLAALIAWLTAKTPRFRAAVRAGILYSGACRAEIPSRRRPVASPCAFRQGTSSCDTGRNRDRASTSSSPGCGPS